MSESRKEWKVGAFVILGLVLLAALVLNFSKGLSLLKPSYLVRLKTTNVGGIKEKAAVLLAGVTVGHVSHVELADDSKSVVIFLRIDKRFDIPGDASWVIEAQGFLGDQYVSIAPTKNAMPPLPKDDTAQRECRSPFNIQDAARDALGLVQRLDAAAQKIDEAVDRVNQNVLNEGTLTNFSALVADFRAVAAQTRIVTERAVALEDKAIRTLDHVDTLLATNTAPIQIAVSNVLRFSEQLHTVGGDLQATVNSARPSVQTTLRNLETASAQVSTLVGEVQAGRGTLGALLKDDAIAHNIKQLSTDLAGLGGKIDTTLTNLNSLGGDARNVMTNLNYFLGDGRLLASNGTVLMSNLNTHGLFYGFFSKPKTPKPTNSAPVEPLLPPRQRGGLN